VAGGGVGEGIGRFAAGIDILCCSFLIRKIMSSSRMLSWASLLLLWRLRWRAAATPSLPASRRRMAAFLMNMMLLGTNEANK